MRKIETVETCIMEYRTFHAVVTGHELMMNIIYQQAFKEYFDLANIRHEHRIEEFVKWYGNLCLHSKVKKLFGMDDRSVPYEYRVNSQWMQTGIPHRLKAVGVLKAIGEYRDDPAWQKRAGEDDRFPFVANRRRSV